MEPVSADGAPATAPGAGAACCAVLTMRPMSRSRCAIVVKSCDVRGLQHFRPLDQFLGVLREALHHLELAGEHEQAPPAGPSAATATVAATDCARTTGRRPKYSAGRTGRPSNCFAMRFAGALLKEFAAEVAAAACGAGVVCSAEVASASGECGSNAAMD